MNRSLIENSIGSNEKTFLLMPQMTIFSEPTLLQREYVVLLQFSPYQTNNDKQQKTCSRPLYTHKPNDSSDTWFTFWLRSETYLINQRSISSK